MIVRAMRAHAPRSRRGAGRRGALRPKEPRAVRAAASAAAATETSGISRPPMPSERMNGTGTSSSRPRPIATAPPENDNRAPGGGHRPHDRGFALAPRRAPRGSAGRSAASSRRRAPARSARRGSSRSDHRDVVGERRRRGRASRDRARGDDERHDDREGQPEEREKTRSASGIAIASPRRRSEVNTGSRSAWTAGCPVTSGGGRREARAAAGPCSAWRAEGRARCGYPRRRSRRRGARLRAPSGTRRAATGSSRAAERGRRCRSRKTTVNVPSGRSPKCWRGASRPVGLGAGHRKGVDEHRRQLRRGEHAGDRDGRPAGENEGPAAEHGTGPALGHLAERTSRCYSPNVWASRKTFSAMITAATTIAATVVMRRLTSAPIRSRRDVNMISGMSANGIPNESTTWREHERARRVDADRDHDERRDHRHDPRNQSGM